mmetsp:Transcript_28857/g.89841  ORF Transcript_28857/g.89841 Transcript_28857/m.89841 type:complete len:157 (-) Transcript_28857:591-1061(-)
MRDKVQLESGETIPAQHVIKVLGYIGDKTVDKVMGIKQMEGFHCNGDFRRLIFSESPGIDAGKFGGTSFSPGMIGISEMQSWFLNYPGNGQTSYATQLHMDAPKRGRALNELPVRCAPTSKHHGCDPVGYESNASMHAQLDVHAHRIGNHPAAVRH